MYYKTDYLSPLGRITLASDGENLVGLWFEGQKYFAESIKEKMFECKDFQIFDKTKDWLNQYFSGLSPDIKDLALAPCGSEFRQSVWKILCEIPYGWVITYGEIAKKLAEKQKKKCVSAQAVGGAVGHNPISVIIPCHRVVGTNGNLTGYAGGIDVKAKLLQHEGLLIRKIGDKYILA